MKDTTKEILKGVLGVDKIGSEVVPDPNQTWHCLHCGDDVKADQVGTEVGIRPVSWLCWCVKCTKAESERLKQLFGIS